MNFKCKVTPVDKKTNDEKDMFDFKLSIYKSKIEGKFERSELRHLIEIIDNAI